LMKTGMRAANPNRTMLGATQLAWLKQTLLDAEAAGVPWKLVGVSSPIDQLGPVGGALAASLMAETPGMSRWPATAANRGWAGTGPNATRC